MVKTLERHRNALCKKHVIVPFCCSYQVYRYLAGCFGLISCRHYLADVRMYFEDADDGDSFNTFQTIEKNAGRIEKRICRKARDIAWLAAHKWPGLRSVFAVERIVDVRGMLSKETSYYISSSDVSARELLGAVREHWKIESLHWLLDVTFSEDESRFLSENAHTIMNALRKFALTVHKNYLAASGKKRSLKANMLAALIRPENLLDLFAFL